MNFNTLDTLGKIETETVEKLSTGKEEIKNLAENFAKSFLGDEIKYLEKNKISEILLETENKFAEDEIEKNLVNNLNEKNVSYNKYKKSFEIKGENDISMGNIISARRLGVEVSLPKDLEKFGDGKKIHRIMLEKNLNDFLCGKLNKELAKNLSEKIKQQDVLKSKAYEKISERSGVENKQAGVMAEQMIIGVLEGLSIDRSDLGFNVLEANAYQDVNNKIDFIIETKKAKRGVGVNREGENTHEFKGKSIGIQFTINSSKAEHKADQIAKAKERGLEVDDIIYVQLDSKILHEAVSKWEKAGKSVSGPWKFLSSEVRILTLTNLFKDILSEEQIKSLTKNIK